MTLLLPNVRIDPVTIDWQGLSGRFVNPGEIETLVTLLRFVGAQRFAEIGCNNGRTAKLLLDNVPTLTEYIGIDITQDWQPTCRVQRNEVPSEPGKYALADPRFKLSVTPRGSYDFSVDMLGALDAIFIDGDHSRAAVEHDTELAFRTVKKGGLVIWHDYHDLGNVDVRDVLHDYHKFGNKEIVHISGTWLATLIVR